MNKHKLNFRLKDKHYLVLFLAPAVIAVALLTIYPLLYSAKISLFGWDLVKPESINKFVGLKNYIEILHSSEFWKAFSITVQYTVISVFFAMVVGVALAFLMYQEIKGTNIVRTFIIAAMVMTPVIVGTAWRLMYNPGWGLINYFLDVIGIGGRPFLAIKSTVLPALIVTDVWEWSPLVMIIILAALQGLPYEIYESARVDGASSFQIFVKITLPLLKPALLLALLIRTMDCFRTFDTIFAMTGGGPGTESQNLNILMYNTGFEFFKISKAAAMAILSLVIITTVCTFLVKLFRKEDTSAW